MKPHHPVTDDLENPQKQEIPEFKPIRLIAFVLFLLLSISVWLKWYTGAVSLPRYCKNPVETMQYLEKVLTKETPAGNDPRRPYLIAAKLIYLIPQQRNESIPDYLNRLRVRIEEQCR